MSPLGPSVSFRDAWVLSRVAPNLDREGEARHLRQLHRYTYSHQGYTSTHHLDESIALCNYLNKKMSVESAARAITAGFSESYPAGVAYGASARRNQLWELLASILLRFEDDCDMIVDLLVAIQTLPSMNSKPWWATHPQPSDSLCELPSFHNVWQSCYESLRCQCHKGEDESFSVDKKYYRRAGTAEAKMYLRGIPGITDFMGYKTINLICIRNEDLEFVIHEMHAWLQTAGSKLAETLDSNKIMFFVREVRGRPGKYYDVSVTMFEHWQHWKKSFLEVSFDENLLSSEGRGLARECHDIMKAQIIKPPLLL